MKIIEGMKELKLIEKKMMANCQKIEQYSSTVSTERPFFENEKTQTKEVEQLVQANLDLGDRYLQIKRLIERTNLEITAEFDGKTYTLSDLLVIKRRMGERMMDTYKSLSSKYADARLKLAPKDADGKLGVVVRLYDERKRNTEISKLLDFMSNIDARLEVINATTDLVGA